MIPTKDRCISFHPYSSVLTRREVPTRSQYPPPGSQVFCPFPSSSTFSIFSVISGSNSWLVDRPEKILFRTKDPSSDMVIADFWHVGHLKFRARDMSHMYHTSFGAKHLDFRGAAHVRRGMSRTRSPKGAEPKEVQQACRSLVNRMGLLAIFANRSW